MNCNQVPCQTSLCNILYSESKLSECLECYICQLLLEIDGLECTEKKVNLLNEILCSYNGRISSLACLTEAIGKYDRCYTSKVKTRCCYCNRCSEHTVSLNPNSKNVSVKTCK